jgi:osomolarity two-component system sensor histidine kinase SLN1
LQGNNLVTIAVLKSVQINQTINFFYNQAFAITTRVMIQQALVDYYTEAQSPDTEFPGAYNDLKTAIGTQAQILEGRMYTNDFTPLTNLTVSVVPYDFPNMLFPTTIPPVDPSNNATTGQLLGPIAVPAAPGTYALSITIPVLNTITNSTPLMLGYISMVFTATGLLRAVNDSTGMGQTGQLLVVAKNGDHFDVMLPPFRTPQVYGQDFLPGQYPAVDFAFKNRTGYLISTYNAAGSPVSVGYNV